MQLTALSDRTHGVSSLQEGFLEMMIHRRILTSDLKGPLAINDTDRLENIRSMLLFSPISLSAPLRHKLSYLLQFPPFPLFSLNATCLSDFSAPAALPEAIHLVTLSFLRADTLLVRFANVFEPADNSSGAVTFDVAETLPFITALQERTLTAVASVDQTQQKRLAWSEKRSLTIQTSQSSINNSTTTATTTITLIPGQIKTYYATVSEHNNREQIVALQKNVE